METIRRLKRDDDLADLINLSREFFAEYEAHHKEFFDIDGLEDVHISDYFTTTIDPENQATFVAMLDRKTIGYITVHVRPQPAFYRMNKVGAISGLMVQREHRRSGIASRLLAKAQAFFKDQGVRYFSVYTAISNDAALRFYETNGMAPLYTTFIGKVDIQQI